MALAAFAATSYNEYDGFPVLIALPLEFLGYEVALFAIEAQLWVGLLAGYLLDERGAPSVRDGTSKAFYLLDAYRRDGVNGDCLLSAVTAHEILRAVLSREWVAMKAVARELQDRDFALGADERQVLLCDLAVMRRGRHGRNLTLRIRLR